MKTGKKRRLNFPGTEYSSCHAGFTGPGGVNDLGFFISYSPSTSSETIKALKPIRQLLEYNFTSDTGKDSYTAQNFIQ
jgi:hypothetical protein